jgi:hypothetical protein
LYDFKVLHFYTSLSLSWRIFQFLIVKNICRPKLIQQKALWPWAITCWFIMWTIQALESLWFKDKWPSTFNSIALLNFFSSGYLFYDYDPPLSRLEIYDNSLWFNQSPVLHANLKIIVFRSRGTIAITWRPTSVVCNLFTFQASSLKPLGQLEPNLAGMFLGWSSTKFLFFVPVRYSTLLPGPIICSDWLKFQRSSSLKLMNWLNPNCKWMIIGMFFSETTWTIETKLFRNVHLMGLYKFSFFMLIGNPS